MVNGETAQWYAIRTRSRCEKVVRDQLTGRGIEPLLPLRRHMSQWKDRRNSLNCRSSLVIVSVVLFPISG